MNELRNDGLSRRAIVKAGAWAAPAVVMASAAPAWASSNLVSIGDYVWYDDNDNGIQDPGEEPAPGVKVNLYDENGSPISDTTTDKNGFYSFYDLQPSTPYIVEFVAPGGYTFTTAGPDGRVDVLSPAAGTNSATDPDDPTIDAGLIPLSGGGS